MEVVTAQLLFPLPNNQLIVKCSVITLSLAISLNQLPKSLCNLLIHVCF